MLKSPALFWQLGQPLQVGQQQLTPSYQSPGMKWAMGDGVILWRQLDSGVGMLWQALLGQLDRVGLPTWLDAQDELVALRGPALGGAFERSKWQRLDLLEAAHVLLELTKNIAALHELGYALGGLRRDELIWDEQRRVLWVAGLPRLQELKARDAEQLWADVQLIGQLLFESYAGRPYPGARQVVEMLREREPQRAHGMLMPSLVQLLASLATPFGDLANLSIQEVVRDLEQLIIELDVPLRARVGARSTQGNNIFRRNNQDSCGHLLFETTIGSKTSQVGFFCVADGIGGQADGQRASALAVRCALEAYARAWMSYGSDELVELAGALARGIVKVVSQRLVLEGELEPGQNRGGTTFTGLILAQDRVGLCHVGDSAALLVREGQLYWLTKEHTLATLLRELGELGDEPLAKNHIAQRTISRFLTTNYELELDRIDGFSPQSLEQLGLPPDEPMATMTTRRGDLFILMSDGLSGELEDEDYLEIMERWQGPQAICDALIERALERAGRDNITALVISIT